MDGTDNMIAAFLFLGAIVVFGACFGSWTAGHSSGTHSVRCEAVECGVAEWIPTADGSTTFRWKVPE